MDLLFLKVDFILKTGPFIIRLLDLLFVRVILLNLLNPLAMGLISVCLQYWFCSFILYLNYGNRMCNQTGQAERILVKGNGTFSLFLPVSVSILVSFHMKPKRWKSCCMDNYMRTSLERWTLLLIHY